MARVKEHAEKQAAKKGIVVTESQMIRELRDENDKLKKEENKSSHKCEGCDEIIYYQSYCERCNKSFES